jgi:hypothetical protein
MVFEELGFSYSAITKTSQPNSASENTSQSARLTPIAVFNQLFSVPNPMVIGVVVLRADIFRSNRAREKY